jgi:IPT/TIG domain-containing protein
MRPWVTEMTELASLTWRSSTRACARFLLVPTFFLLAAATALHAATVTATWNPNPESDIAGYRLLYGTQSGNYTTTLDVGNVTTSVVTVTAGQTYFFVVQAYDTSGLTSPNSAEASVAVPAGTAPILTSVTPSSGAIGTPVVIAGTNFGATQGTSTVTFNGVAATPTSWSATSITVPVPASAGTGAVVVTVGGLVSNSLSFTVTVPPTLASLSPATGPVGTSVTIAGTSFGATQGTSTVKFNGTTATPTSWSATSIVVPVPTGASTGTVVVTVGGLASNGLNFTVIVPPTQPTGVVLRVGP